MFKKICDVIKQFIFKSIVKKCRIENFKIRKYENHRKNEKYKFILSMKRMQIRINFQIQWMNSMSNVCKISLKNSYCFWRNDIEFNTETRKTRIFVIETNMLSQCSRRKWMISVSNSCRNIENEKSEKLIRNLNLEMLLNSSRMLKSRNWFVKQTNVIFENFSRIKNDSNTDMKLSILKILSKNWLISKLDYWNYFCSKKEMSICYNQ